MSTVLLATGETACMKALGETYPVPMLPLIDRPFIQHVIEFLIGQGRTDIDVILSHLPQQIENLLGDGSRWGCRFRFHLIRDFSQIGRTLKTIIEKDDEPCLLADATTIPKIDLSRLRSDMVSDGPIFYCLRDGEDGRDEFSMSWTGWALLPHQAVKVIPVLYKWGDLYQWALVRFRKRCRIIQTQNILKLETYADLLSSHREVLEKQFPGLLLTGREVEDGIWLSRNVEIHPRVQITPPVFIGQNCRIGSGVHLGPFAVIGRNCVLDENSSVSNSVIFPDTYVGAALELQDVIVDRNRLINERYSSETTITDDFILSNLKEQHVRKWLSGTFSRLFSLILLMVALPFFPFLCLYLKAKRRGPIIHWKQAVTLPAEYDPTLWKTYTLLSFLPIEEEGCKRSDQGRIAQGFMSTRRTLKHFLFRFLPGLVSVALGDLQVLGVQPRSKEEIMLLDKEWRIIYLKSKAGLITESFINFGSDALPDEVYSAEMLYSTSFSRKKDLMLLARYFGRVLKDLALSRSN